MRGQPAPTGHQLPRRVILLIDLDCWYCQVEQKRLGIPRDVPCAVQQWEGLIAVNYAARAAGITRHMRVGEAKKKCPELQLVHVQTIGGEHSTAPGQPLGTSTAATASSSEGHATAQEAEAAPLATEVEGSAADRGSSKASLQRYRKASAEIMRLLAHMAPGCAFEKASIDEAYIDVTQLALQELSRAEAVDGGLADLLSRAAEASIVLGDGGLQADVEFDRLAAAGAVIAARLREAVAQQLQFTCSAGVGPNKVLAKICSGLNKPNKQTVVLPRAVEGLMAELPLGKVKGLGGKLGAKLEGLGANSAGAAAAISWEVLVDAFGSKALWVWETVRGIDNEPVVPKSLVKSINSCKSFEPTSDAAAINKWLVVLAAELSERMAEDEADNTRRARTLVLQYRSSSVRNAPDRSIRAPLPRCGRDGYATDSIAAAGLTLFRRINPPPYPLVRLALAATEFADLPGHGGSGSTSALARFLAQGAQQAQQAQQHQPQHQQQDDGQQDTDHPRPPPNVFQHHLAPPPRKAANVKQHLPGQARLEQLFHQAPPAPAAKPEQPSVCPAAASSLPAHQHYEQAGLGPAEHPHGQQPGPQEAPEGQDAGAQHIPVEVPMTSGGSSHDVAGPCSSHKQHVRQEEPKQQQQKAEQQESEQHTFDGKTVGSGSRQEPDMQEQQPSLEELAALAGVDVASQARILRDIEVRSMLHKHKPQPVSGSGSHQGPNKRKGAQQGSRQDGKQMRISSLFGPKQ